MDGQEFAIPGTTSSGVCDQPVGAHRRASSLTKSRWVAWHRPQATRIEKSGTCSLRIESRPIMDEIQVAEAFNRFSHRNGRKSNQINQHVHRLQDIALIHLRLAGSWPLFITETVGSSARQSKVERAIAQSYSQIHAGALNEWPLGTHRVVVLHGFVFVHKKTPGSRLHKARSRSK